MQTQKSTKKKILCTGSGGFIFGNFSRQAFYTNQNYSIASIDRIRDSNNIWNVYVNSDHKFYIADIRDAHVLSAIFQVEKPDIVIHGAAETSVEASVKNAEPFITSNVLGTQNVIDMCLRWNVKKLIYISTDQVYGPLSSESDPSFTEASPINPKNPYAASKAAGELLVQAAHHTHGLVYNITRSCNCYGPWQHPSKLIPKIINSVIKQQPMPVYGQGAQIRDWLHVFDKCSAIFSIINNGVDNQIYNISANQELSNIEVFQRVCNTLEKGHELISFTNDNPYHDFRYSLDSSKLKDIGWNIEYKFKEGIVPTCQWYINNQFFFRQFETDPIGK